MTQFVPTSTASCLGLHPAYAQQLIVLGRALHVRLPKGSRSESTMTLHFPTARHLASCEVPDCPQIGCIPSCKHIRPNSPDSANLDYVFPGPRFPRVDCAGCQTPTRSGGDSDAAHIHNAAAMRHCRPWSCQSKIEIVRPVPPWFPTREQEQHRILLPTLAARMAAMPRLSPASAASTTEPLLNEPGSPPRDTAVALLAQASPIGPG